MKAKLLNKDADIYKLQYQSGYLEQENENLKSKLSQVGYENKILEAKLTFIEKKYLMENNISSHQVNIDFSNSFIYSEQTEEHQYFVKQKLVQLDFNDQLVFRNKKL